MKAVKFRKSWNKYNAGETAGFEDDQAEALVKAGIAALVGPVSALPDTAVVQAMADVQRVAQREQVRLAQIAVEQDGRAEALARQEADLAAREAALAAREAALAARFAELQEAMPAEPEAEDTGADGGEDAPEEAEDAGGLPKQGRK